MVSFGGSELNVLVQCNGGDVEQLGDFLVAKLAGRVPRKI
jgi:hypothetical protein